MITVLRAAVVAVCAFAVLMATAATAQPSEAVTDGVRTFYCPTCQLDTSQVTDLRAIDTTAY